MNELYVEPVTANVRAPSTVHGTSDGLERTVRQPSRRQVTSRMQGRTAGARPLKQKRT